MKRQLTLAANEFERFRKPTRREKFLAENVKNVFVNDVQVDEIWQFVLCKRATKKREKMVGGCGDSYCAALAARSFMMDATGKMAEPVEALEFSRYLVSYIPHHSFVFGVSNSGTVSRTNEGVRLARERGVGTSL